MEAWREQLKASREFLLEDFEEDRINLEFVSQASVSDDEEVVAPVRGGLRSGGIGNIERHRLEMHEHMI
jgi:hypothetical protein